MRARLSLMGLFYWQRDCSTSGGPEHGHAHAQHRHGVSRDDLSHPAPGAMSPSARASRSDSAPDTGHDVDTPAGEVTAQGAAARVGVHARTVRRAIARGELPAIKRHGAFHIALADLAAWHARRTAGPSATPAGTGMFPGRALPRPVTALVGRERE